MSETKLFPQGIALGEAFCDREELRKKLQKSFLNNEHTVIVAPRRYGKTSLIQQVLLDSKLVGKRIDLLPATDVGFVYKAVRSCVSELMNAIAPKTKKILQTVVDSIRSLHPKLTLNLLGQYLEINSPQPSESSLIDLLLGLNTAAKLMKQQLVICCDEFQQIGSLKDHHNIEASIRHAVESSTNITYVFSGSSRHLLSQMFSSKSRPLYRLCNLLRLERIPQAIYFEILNSRILKEWGDDVNKAVAQEILQLTQCHSYHVNGLCRLLWAQCEKPTVALVQQLWFDYLESQTPWICDDLASLTPNQRRVLAGISHKAVVAELFSQQFSQMIKTAPSSIRKAVDFLMKEDWIYKGERGHALVDPVIQTYLQQTPFFDFQENN